MKETVVISAARTPFGKFGGALKSFSAVDLGSIAIRETVKRSGIKGGDVDLVIMGQVLQAGCGQIPSRQATLKAGLPMDVPSETLNKVCASSFRAVTLADQIIRSGDARTILAGGMESMSNAPYGVASHRWGQRMFHSQMLDLMVHDGLWCATYDRHMAVHGGVVAKEYRISREQQDEWALRSQLLANHAIANGKLKDEIVPVMVRSKKGDTVFDTDESPRSDVTMDSLAKLPPLFADDNTVTAGNAPGTNDGGSAIMLMSRERAEELGAKPLGAIVAGKDVLYVTERAVFRLVPGGIELIEIAPGVELERDILSKMAFTPILCKQMKTMDPRIFTDALMHLELRPKTATRKHVLGIATVAHGAVS